MLFFKSVSIRQVLTSLLVVIPGLYSGIVYADAAGQWRDGKQVYEKICSYCHDTGVGTELRDFARPPEYTRYVVRNGLRAMPAFRASEIDDEALDKLAEYIKSRATQ